MSLKDIEPDILLILLGSLFILIGASGKLFIEKFSIALASIGPRLLVSILGLGMLGIGIVGPNKLFPDQSAVPSTASQVDSSSAHPTGRPWFHKISGTYTGITTSAGADHPVNTTLAVDATGNITGTYVIEEPKKTLGGKLDGAKVLGPGSIELDWKDDAGRGKLRIAFSEDLNSFSGNWGGERQLALNHKWTGSKRQ
ncbi:MAG: hypothetical protein D4R84_06570 [Rhodocyclaceae bacterium]|nr:MAG: hypothetical protein D4R84_06570 [Rhodocyclaceae bacterium]